MTKANSYIKLNNYSFNI